ncbi:MAG: DUF6266 family protein [bacterium]
MAKQTEGINGGFIGRVGTVVGYQWRGKWCVRSYPRHINDARTPGQLRQREWFKLAVQLASRLTPTLRAGMRERSRRLQMTEGNYFISLNKECFGLEEGRLTVDYARLTVADGPVAPVGFGTPALVAGERNFTVTVDFDRNPLHLPVENDDKVYLAALCEEEADGVLSSPAFRREERAALRLPAAWEGKTVHLYGFVQDYNGEASASQYLGSLRVEEPQEKPVPTVSPIGAAPSAPAGEEEILDGEYYSMAAAISAARDLSSSGLIST